MRGGNRRGRSPSRVQALKTARLTYPQSARYCVDRKYEQPIRGVEGRRKAIGPSRLLLARYEAKRGCGYLSSRNRYPLGPSEDTI